MPRIFSKPLLNLFFVICIVAGLIQPTIATLNFVFLYFNPDSAQSNFSTLKRSVDGFFKENGMTIPSQAFSQKVDFDQQIQSDTPALALVPVWYFDHYGKTMGLKPLLTAVHNGKTNYTKILLARSDSKLNLSELNGKTVAMTTMGPDTENKFSSLYLNEYGVNLSGSNIIITPKDVDALYALILGQVDAALVSKDTLNIVGRANQKVVDMVKELAASDSFPTPLLCITGSDITEKELESIRTLFLEGSNKASNQNFMRMLSIDGWKIFAN